MRPTFFIHAHFRLELTVPFSASCFVPFSYVRNKWSNEVRVLSWLWHLLFFFELSPIILTKIVLERPYLNKSLRVLPWCAHNVFFPQPIIMVSLLITRFLHPLCAAPSLLPAVCYFLLDAQWSVIVSRSSLLFLHFPLFAVWLGGVGGGRQMLRKTEKASH